MGYIKIKNVCLSGISACVPKQIEENRSLHLFENEAEANNLITSTGIERRHLSAKDQTASDLCFSAAKQLLEDLHWSKDSIDALVFVTQTPDYVQPATSCILQDCLGLSKDCCALDISSGCSGWVYGMSVLTSLLSSGFMKRGLLLCGDVSTKIKSPRDKASWPLFGDAGTATAFEYRPNISDIDIILGTDGAGYDAILMKDGGMRHPFSESSLEYKEIEPGRWATDGQTQMKGMDVFLFGITVAPKITNDLLEQIKLEKEKVDYFVFHQANSFLNERVRKKLKIPPEKVPYSLKDFGNTSSASIPLTMVTQMREALFSEELSLITTAFGIGLSWGCAHLNTSKVVCSKLIES